MGAHTMGRNHKKNSGYEGEYVVGSATDFDNQYYIDMIDSDITWVSKYFRKFDTHQWEAIDANGDTIGKNF